VDGGFQCVELQSGTAFEVGDIDLPVAGEGEENVLFGADQTCAVTVGGQFVNDERCPAAATVEGERVGETMRLPAAMSKNSARYSIYSMTLAGANVPSATSWPPMRKSNS
jgi:hypothetical protein